MSVNLSDRNHTSFFIFARGDFSMETLQPCQQWARLVFHIHIYFRSCFSTTLHIILRVNVSSKNQSRSYLGCHAYRNIAHTCCFVGLWRVTQLLFEATWPHLLLTPCMAWIAPVSVGETEITWALVMETVCVPALVEGVYLDPVVCVLLQDLPGVLVSVERVHQDQRDVRVVSLIQVLGGGKG